MGRCFEELKIWQEARLLTVEIYSHNFGNNDFGFRDQIQRASVSIMNNIAEGSEAGSDAMFVKYLYTAKGSCAEVRSMLILAKDLGYIKNNDVLIEKSIYISKGISKLIEFLCKNK